MICQGKVLCRKVQHFLCPPPGKQLGQQILHLRIHQEGGGEAHVPAGPQLLGKGVRVVEEDEMRLAVPGIGEIPGAQVLGEENGEGLPVQQVLEFPAAERAALAALSREGEVHPQPLDIQGQTACPVPSGSGLLQALDKVPAGDGGADQGNGA